MLFVPHFTQDVTAFYSAQTGPEPDEGELPFAIFENCPVANNFTPAGLQ